MKEKTILKDIVVLLETLAKRYEFQNCQRASVDIRDLSNSVLPREIFSCTGVMTVLLNKIEMVWIVPNTRFILTTKIQTEAFKNCKNKKQIKEKLYASLANYFVNFSYPDCDKSNNNAVVYVLENSFVIDKAKAEQAVAFLHHVGASLKQDYPSNADRINLF